MRPRFARCFGSLAILACVAACGGSPKVRFKGNKAVDEGDLAKGLAVHEPPWYSSKDVEFDRRDLEDDKERILREYRKRGYFNAKVRETVDDESEPGTVTVEFTIEEGEPVRLANVRFAGAPDDADVNAAALARVAGLRKGRRFRHARYMAAKERLLRHLVSRGFAHAEVRGEVRVQPSALSAVVVFDIDAGPRVRFGPLVVEGLDSTPLSAVENRLAWKEGDRYRPELPATTRARLRTLGFYSTVRVGVNHDGRKAQPPTEVAVVEAPRNTLRLGAGFAYDRIGYGVRGLAGYSRLTALGPLTKFKSEFRPGYVFLNNTDSTDRDSGAVYEARTSIEKDDFVFPLVNGLVGADWSRRQVETYRSEGATLRGRLSRKFADGFLYTGLAYQLQVLCLTGINEQISDDQRTDLGIALPGNLECPWLDQTDVTRYDLGFLEQTVVIDGRDDSVRPRLGYYAAVKLQEAASLFGSDFSFVTATGELRGFVPVGDRVVVAALARWSQLLVGDRLPITRRFFGGGATSQRGFGQRRLTPVADQDNEESVGIGGEAMFEGGLEARFDVATIAGQTLGLVGFVDVGDVTRNASELDPFQAHVAVGGGIRLYTPIGPLRIDLGYRLNRYREGEPDFVTKLNENDEEVPDQDGRWTFHFTLGEAF